MHDGPEKYFFYYLFYLKVKTTRTIGEHFLYIEAMSLNTLANGTAKHIDNLSKGFLSVCIVHHTCRMHAVFCLR